MDQFINKSIAWDSYFNTDYLAGSNFNSDSLDQHIIVQNSSFISFLQEHDGT